jgi:peptidoglycan hydrolase-like protein with peptidoglycan-binding domain
MSESTYSHYPAGRRRKKKRSKLPVVLALLVVVVVAGLVALDVWWPSAAVNADPQALAAVKLAPAGESLSSVTALAGGRRVPVRIRDGKVWPVGKLAPGERVVVHATVKRSSLVGWLVGGTEHVQATFVTPTTHVRTTLLHLAPGAPVQLHFVTPASYIRLKLPGEKTQPVNFGKPRSRFSTGLQATGPNRFGVLTVASAARTWERLSAPQRVSWFPTGTRLEAVVSPAPGAVIEPSTPIQLTLSEPVKAVLGRVRPTLDPAVPGSWVQTAANQLTFHPTGSGYPLGRHITLTLPARTDLLSSKTTQTVQSLTWSIPIGSTMRLQQLLSELGYLPLTWTPGGAPVANTAIAQKQAALNAPEGNFTWRYSDTPQQLQDLWEPGQWTRMTQAAVMAFESDHGLTVDGIPGPVVWHTLIKAAIDGDDAHGYSYVLVHRTVPQTLILWNDGQVILTARVNTGVPQAPTPYGTHAVFEHIPVGTMTGENPDGSHYNDPGVKWISYFNGGEAIHGFNRATYGFPQSVGCVEAPVTTAAQIYPYTPIGTLVTIAP